MGVRNAGGTSGARAAISITFEGCTRPLPPRRVASLAPLFSERYRKAEFAATQQVVIPPSLLPADPGVVRMDGLAVDVGLPGAHLLPGYRQSPARAGQNIRPDAV